MPSFVLTLIGPDRPGLVDSVAAVVKENQANWLESRMAHLAGHFAGIVRVEIAESHAEQLVEGLGQLESKGLSITVRRDAEAQAPAEIPLVRLQLVGNDRPGIVSEVSRVLAEHHVNVEEFHTECGEAPNSGSTLFHAEAQLCLPPELALAELQGALEGIAVDLMVDIQLKDQ